MLPTKISLFGVTEDILKCSRRQTTKASSKMTGYHEDRENSGAAVWILKLCEAAREARVELDLAPDNLYTCSSFVHLVFLMRLHCLNACKGFYLDFKLTGGVPSKQSASDNNGCSQP